MSIVAPKSSKMSARAFAGIPRQFAKAARFQRVRVPQMAPKMWRNHDQFYQNLKELNSVTPLTTKSMRTLVNRLHCAEMQKIQIGALYMFSYVSKEFLELLKHYQDMIDEEEVDEEEERTTLTGRL